MRYHAAMYVETVPNRGSPPAILLRERRSSARKPTQRMSALSQARTTTPSGCTCIALWRLGYQIGLRGCQSSPGCFSRRVDRLHRVLNLFEGARLDLAYTLPAHAEFGGEIC